MTPGPRRRWSRIDFRLVTAVVFVLAVGGFAASRLPGLRRPVLNSAVSAQANKKESIRAPDFQGITTWINSRPLTIGSLKGKVVLVDFWTYSCVNCIRTLPFLKAFYATYHPFGLQIVGVHSPEFSFEKVESNVRAAVNEHGVVWPVAMDNDMRTWGAYRNQYWPHVYLVDRTGRIRYDYIGEGSDEQIQASIRDLLAETGIRLPAPAPLPSVALSTRITPEIYLGPARGAVEGSLGNPQGYRQGTFDYPAPRSSVIQQAGPGGHFFLGGRWSIGDESVRAVQAGSRVFLYFYAKDVYLVGGPIGASPGGLRVSLDGRAVSASVAGEDVHDGAVALSRLDLYHVIHLGAVQPHLLTLTATGPSVELFTFTFG